MIKKSKPAGGSSHGYIGELRGKEISLGFEHQRNWKQAGWQATDMQSKLLFRKETNFFITMKEH